jgi:hypothetical protein
MMRESKMPYPKPQTSNPVCVRGTMVSEKDDEQIEDVMREFEAEIKAYEAKDPGWFNIDVNYRKAINR